MRWYWTCLEAFLLHAAAFGNPLGPQTLTVVPKGPIHVMRDRLVDSRGAVFLIRGTGLPEFRTAAMSRPSDAVGQFGPHSATVFSAIRLRWNLNAVRLPLNLSDYRGDPRYLQAASEVVRRANDLDLLVILSADDKSAATVPSGDLVRFWRDCAAFFRSYPQLIFELEASGEATTQTLIDAVRASGAEQPVFVGSGWGDALVDDRNAIYGVRPSYRTTRTDADRDRLFAPLTNRVPALAEGLDPELDRNSDECAALPGDPSDAEALVQANLEYFDAHAISWVLSEFRPGRLITDYRNMFPTSLENGWTCGEAQARFGIGEMIQFHLWGGELRGLFAVSATGSFVLPRGGIGILYGGIFAEQDTPNTQTPPPTELSQVSVVIRDRTGRTHRAGLLYVSAGWGQANFVVPPGCVPGPAQVIVERRDGSRASTPAIIADVAPGFWTLRHDGRGPVAGVALRADRTSFDIFRCDRQLCSTRPIPVSARSSTTVRLRTSGLRYAAGLSGIRVTIGGIRVPVTAFGPADDPGVDQLTIQIPPSLRGAGETDLVCSVQGQLSNVARIHIGSTERSQ